MEYAHLGRSGLRVSRLCLGTMNFGPDTEESDAHDMMHRAHELGINFFDTSNVYGWKKGEGLTEQIVGRWFAKGGGRREKTVIATKLYGSMSDWPNDTFLSALNIRRACDASLKRLQTDHIDLYQMHHIDRATPWEEIWEAMDVLRQQGKIIYVGSSNFAGWHIAKAQEAAKAELLWPHFRAVDLQPRPEAGRARGGSRLPGLRTGAHPVEPSARRSPGRRSAEGAQGEATDEGPFEGCAREPS